MLESRKIVLKETGIVAAGVAICCGLMLCVFALLGKFDLTVLWGALAGGFLTVANFFVMAVGTAMAADKAQEQDVGAGKNVIRSSMALRLLLISVFMFALARSGLCNVFSLVLPLLFVRPVITITQFFRKKG